MNKYLLYLETEEMPSSEYDNIKNQLEEAFKDNLQKRKIEYKDINVFIAPRRFGVYITDLSEGEEDTTEERKGPAKVAAYDKDGNPTKALNGFLRSCGKTENDVTIKEFNSAEYVFVKIDKKGFSTKEILSEISPEIIKKLNFKKSMRWGNGEYSFVRPIHNIISVFNDEKLDIELFGKKSSFIIKGHRFFGENFELENTENLFQKLEENYVIPFFEKRTERIKEEIKRVENKYGINVDSDGNLINEIAQLTEYPSAVVGEFKEKYMYLPEEVITTTIKHHQRSFVAKENGKISNKYVSFQDGYGREENITKGYSVVINSRLDDAAFYYDDDMETKIEDRLEKLNGITYQQGLGTYYDKVKRIVKLSDFIAGEIGTENKNTERAALLCKIDIPSSVVFEFPELQGKMAEIYLKNKNENYDVYKASEEHYHPVEETDCVPENEVSGIISLADRIDDIVGYFCIGKIPTGSKDPFALRRKAFGVIRIITENNWDIDLEKIINYSKEIYSKGFDTEKMNEFFMSRFETILIKENIKTDVIKTVVSNWKKPLRVYKISKMLNEYTEKDIFRDFMTAFQRINNISKNYEKNSFDENLFVLDAEKNLYKKYSEIFPIYTENIKNMKYSDAVEIILGLKNYIDNYFEDVFVMDKDDNVKNNRLGFLRKLSELFLEIGDISRLYQ